MKILWVLNMVLPDAAKKLNIKTSFSGGWLIDYVKHLSTDDAVELATMTYANVESPIKQTVEGVKHYIFPGGGKRLLFTSPKTLADCEYVINDFKPDIIHLHGTEYSIAYSMVKLQPGIPLLLTIQGILDRISKEYKGGLSKWDFYKATVFKQLIRFNSPFFAEKLFLLNAKREKYVLKNVTRVTGRTLWDKAVMQSINSELEYYRLNYNLRPEFYEAEKWDWDRMTPHTIYTGAATYSLKGLHILIDALSLVKCQYPDVKLYIPGNSVTYNASNGYERFIRKRIRKLNLENNVEFIGKKSAIEVADILSKVHVCVVPSAMEGASATLCEAMMIGTPSISAFRGGMTDLLRDGESGFYYDFPEYPVLAERICTLFDDRNLCENFSEKTILDASRRHDRETNYCNLKNIYAEMLTGDDKS